MSAFDVIAEKVLATDWHWLKYHFTPNHLGYIHFLSSSVSDACDMCEQHITGYTEEFANRLASYKDKEKFQPHYEQIIQLLSELYVVSHLAELSLDGVYIHEPVVGGSDKNPELGITSEDGELYVEVKCSEYINHHNKRGVARIEVPTRMEGARESAERLLKPGETLVLPRDNVIKDFLISANDKFNAFKARNPNATCVLVIVWSDFIYEPISSLTNKASGLLTNNSFFKEGGKPVEFNNIDAIVVVRHSHQIVMATRDQSPIDGIRHPLDWGYRMGLLPKALIPITDNVNRIEYISQVFDAIHIDELQHIAEYRPQDFILKL